MQLTRFLLSVFVAFEVAFLATLSADAQKFSIKDLELTGTLVSISTRCIDGHPIPQVSYALQFRNAGNEPAILIRPSSLFRKRLEFASIENSNSVVSGDVLTYNPYLENPFGQAQSSDYDPFPYFMESLNKSDPPVILNAGNYYEFVDTVWVRNGFEVQEENENKSKKCEERKVKVVPNYLYFNIEYSLSVKKYDSGNEFFKRLRTRWRSSGELLLDSNGDVSYKSTRIFIKVDN